MTMPRPDLHLFPFSRPSRSGRRAFAATADRASTHILIGVALAAAAFLTLHLGVFTGLRPIHPMSAAGIALLLISAFAVLFINLRAADPALLRSTSRLLTYGMLCLVPLIVARVCALNDFSALFVPFGIVIFIIALRHGTHVALTTAFILALFTAIALRKPSAPVVDPQALALLGGAVVWTFGARRIRKRLWLLQVGLVAALVQTALSIAADLLAAAGSNPGFTEFANLNAAHWIESTLNALVTGGILSAFLPVIEYLFRVHTDIRLLELADLNQPLLKRLNTEAPGTYHHSLTVGNMAAAATEELGANPLLARVGSYFHDVGKLEKPGHFVENEGTGASPHAHLTPSMSALVIGAHVKDGAELARQSGLPQEIIDIIHQHHGTSLMEYFYRRSLEHPGGTPPASDEIFRYPGPKPRTIESAIITLADAVEAASRTLPDPTPARLRELVREVITKKVLDGQLDDSPLTLAQVTQIENTFTRILSAAYHSRINHIAPAGTDDPAGAVEPGENSPT